jgi:H+/gluconate symporter-like permease
MSYQEFAAIPNIETAFFQGKTITPKPGFLLWSNSAPPPKIGSEVIAGGALGGPAVVTGYFARGRWFGLKAKLHNPSEKYVKQNPGNPDVELFGTEFELV